MDAGPLRQAIAAAAETGMPLWCDDAAARQRARGRGVTCFSTIDVLEALAPSNMREQLLVLARARVIDLPLTADEIITLAGETDWGDGPAHTALASAGTWAGAGQSWQSLWRSIAEAAAARGINALTLATQATLTGVLNNASSQQAPRRYLDVVTTALVACQQHGIIAPRFLATVAGRFNPAVAPAVEVVRATLTGALTSVGVDAAPLAACELLGIDLIP